MILVPSAAYVQGDLRSEFGELPPAFLPLGNKPLHHWQVGLLRSTFGGERIVYTVPESFRVPKASEASLSVNDCEVVFVPDSLNLAESLLFSLNVAGSVEEPVRILHGDTLFSDVPDELDVIGVASSRDSYDWQFTSSRTGAGDKVWAGYFSFSDHRLLLRSLATSHGSFVRAVQSYDSVRPLELKESPGWRDLGHLNTYFRSRESFTTERHFNRLRIQGGTVTKGGTAGEKIRSEANWFGSLPSELKIFAPQLISVDEDSPSYELEYLPMPPLNELFVHGRHPASFWDQIFDYCDKWFNRSISIGLPAFDVSRHREKLVVEKSWSRANTFADQLGLDLENPVTVNGTRLQSVSAVVNHCIELVNDLPHVVGVFHGDFCFSNILHDSRAGRIRVLDPRGINAVELGHLAGDLQYDLAKLAHSAVGHYDLIVAGNYHFDGDLGSGEVKLEVLSSPIHELVGREFLEHQFAGFEPNATARVMPLVVLLFLSMASLHSEDSTRQQALFTNGLRIYQDYVQGV